MSNAKNISIGSITLEHATAIAPMEGITDAAFRRLIRQLGGCGLSVTEFVNCEALTRNIKRIWSKTHSYEDERPAAVQIYGYNAQSMGEAAAMCQERGAQIVDLNLGCPAKAVVSGNAGSALTREPEQCKAIFESVRDNLTIPFTVKMRLGWDAKSLNAVEIALLAQEAGAKMVVVHGRTRQEAYRGKARWDRVAPVVQALNIPVLINGDILTIADADEALAQSGAAGIMVGRGLLRNPWLLRQISDDREGREIYQPSLQERLDFILQYIELLQDTMLSETAALGRVKCFMGYFTRALAYASQLRQRSYRAKDIDTLKGYLFEYFEALEKDNLDEIFNQAVAQEGDDAHKCGDPRNYDA